MITAGTTEPVSGSGVPGVVVSFGISAGADWAADAIAHAEADKLAEIRSEYVNRSTSLLYEFQKGAASAGVGSMETGLDDFLEEHAGFYEGHNMSAVEEMVKGIRDTMVAARDD